MSSYSGSRPDSTSSHVRSRLIEIVSRIARIDPEEMADDVLIRDELGIDSLMAMEIVAATEQALEVSIDEGRVSCVETVEDFVQLVENLYHFRPRGD